jgi:hypothetical protein
VNDGEVEGWRPGLHDLPFEDDSEKRSRSGTSSFCLATDEAEGENRVASGSGWQRVGMGRVSHLVFKPKLNAHSICAQKSSLHTYRTENGYRITNVTIYSIFTE